MSLVVAGSAGVHAQAVYVNTDRAIFQLSGGIGGHHRTQITNGCGTDSNVVSIAVYKDTIYYNTWNGELKRFRVGVPGSCETLVENGFVYNSMTVDKQGIIYVATNRLVRYNPHTRQLTELGSIPFVSAGDMLFFNDKLLLAGWDPNDWSTGIYEVTPDNPSASKLYMHAPPFFGLMSLPVTCGNSRHFGLLPTESHTILTELDLANKRVMGDLDSIPGKIMDAASSTETGIDNKISITAVTKINSDNCLNANGAIFITASSPNTPISYTLLNTGISQPSGKFTDLRGGEYRLLVKDGAGCATDTTLLLAENIPAGGCNDMLIPNAFTPNNDGRNDALKVFVPAIFSDISIQVFGRWGNLVYASKGNTIYWDGNCKGVQQPAGVYIYQLTYTDQNGEKKSLKGTLTLIR